MSAISDQYAVALFELALELKKTDALVKDFEAFLDALDEESRTFFLHPKITKNEKKIMIDSFSFEPLFKDFLKVIIENNRFLLLSAILKGVQKLVEEQNNLMHITVFSGKALPKNRIEVLKTQYEQKYHRQVLIDNEIDETIVGGLRFEYNGMVIDDTVNHTLNQLKSRLTK